MNGRVLEHLRLAARSRLALVQAVLGRVDVGQGLCGADIAVVVGAAAAATSGRTTADVASKDRLCCPFAVCLAPGLARTGPGIASRAGGARVAVASAVATGARLRRRPRRRRRLRVRNVRAALIKRLHLAVRLRDLRRRDAVQQTSDGAVAVGAKRKRLAAGVALAVRLAVGRRVGADRLNRRGAARGGGRRRVTGGGALGRQQGWGAARDEAVGFAGDEAC